MPAHAFTDERKALLVAAFFHDIGKFRYRAQQTKAPHAETGADFVRDQLGRFDALKSVAEQIEREVRSHHDPAAGHAVLQRADHLDAMERQEEAVREGRRYLTSVLAAVDIGLGLPDDRTFYYVPGPIGVDHVFPRKEDVPTDQWVPNAEDVMRDHAGPWKEFQEELATVPVDLEFSGLLTTLYALLERWTSRVSSAAYGSVPDISLFDHLRTTAAVADCLLLSENPDEPFLLVEGDIGGIQRFIYRLRTPERYETHMSKQLRGRSFYVGLLTETLARWVLHSLGLFRPNLLVSGGGHFLILAPNTPAAVDELKRCRLTANRWLLEEFHADLTLVLEWLPLREDEATRFDEPLTRLAQQLGRAKTRRAAELLADPHLFGPEEDVQETLRICPVCQALVPESETAGAEIDETTADLCAACRLHERIGKVLPRLKWLVNLTADSVPTDLPSAKAGAVLVPFPRFGQAWALVPGNDGDGLTHLPASLEATLGVFAGDSRLVELLNVGHSYLHPALMDSVTRRSSTGAVGFGFTFVATALPKDGGVPMSFEDIAEKGKGYPYLGFFRADVDNLGYIFARGFRDNRTISRYATLSRELDLFFTAYVDRLAREHDIYVTYSGGDDLFVIGNWGNMVEFFMELQRDFQRLTGSNPNFGLSGGLLITRPSYPVGLAAEEAAEYEEAAKKHPGKNAICLFDHVHPWDRARELLRYGWELARLAEKEKPLRSLVRAILDMHESAFRADGKVDVEQLGRLRPKLYYALARRAGVTARALQKSPREPKVAAFARLLEDETLLRDFPVSAKYALLLTRERQA